MAYALLDNRNETNVCIFEREDRLGGKIFDFNFTQAPDVAVGKPKVILYRHIFRIRIVLPYPCCILGRSFISEEIKGLFSLSDNEKIHEKIFSG